MSRESTTEPHDENGLLLAHVLLAVVLLELAIHRLAVPALRPPREAPPLWHDALAWLGDFSFYFAVALAFVVLGRALWRNLAAKSSRTESWLAYGVAMWGMGLLMLSLVALVAGDSESVSFTLDASFTMALLFLVVAQLPSGGDLGARIGAVLLALPLILHFYAPFVLRFVSGDDVGLPEKMQIFGQWALVFSALATPYCFAPRPFTASAARFPPLVVALFVTTLSAVIVRRAAEVGMDLARDGFGVVLDPLAPVSMLALYIMALAAVTWTLVSCLTAAAPSRRQIGIGIGLLLLGGYGFEWPLQYLLSFLGIMLIAGAARRVDREEMRRGHTQRFAPPAIDDKVWRGYVAALGKLLEDSGQVAAAPSLLTVKDEDGAARTHIVWSEDEIAIRLSIVRREGRVATIDYLAGDEPETEGPSWTLQSRAEPGASPHPPPPACAGRVTRLGDDGFDSRFHMRDASEHGRRLFSDPELRDQANEHLRGWVALWPGRALRHRVVVIAARGPDWPIDAALAETDSDAAVVALAKTLAVLSELVRSVKST